LAAFFYSHDKFKEEKMNVDRIIRDPEATIISGLGRSQRYKLEQAGVFPQRRKLSPLGRATGYLQSELEAWTVSRPVILKSATQQIGSGLAGPGRGNKKQLATA
jgi:predicted DNA-binding transcriptional regulator AlpA